MNATDSAMPVTLRLHRDDGSINTSLSLPIEPGKVRFVEEQKRYCTAQYVGLETITPNGGASIVTEMNANSAKLRDKATQTWTIKAQRFAKVVSIVAKLLNLLSAPDRSRTCDLRFGKLYVYYLLTTP